MADNKAMVQSMYDAISGGGDVSAMLDEHVTTDFVEHEQIPGAPSGLSGRETARQGLETIQDAISGLRFNVEDLIEEGDRVVARLTITGTHSGEFMGIPASGNEIAVSAVDIFQMRDGKVAAHWGVTDSAAMLMQMGAMEPPG